MTHDYRAELDAADAAEAEALDTYRWLALLDVRFDEEPRRTARLRWQDAKRLSARIWRNWIKVGMP